MSRVTIDLPNSFPFSTELDVLISQVNVSKHLGNDSIVAMLNEARLRYMNWLGFEGATMAGFDYINADLAIVYKGEAHYADKLQIEVATGNFGKYGCDFFFKITQVNSSREIATAKAAFLLYDYENQCLQAAPSNFEELFSKT